MVSEIFCLPPLSVRVFSVGTMMRPMRCVSSSISTLRCRVSRTPFSLLEATRSTNQSMPLRYMGMSTAGSKCSSSVATESSRGAEISNPGEAAAGTATGGAAGLSVDSVTGASVGSAEGVDSIVASSVAASMSAFPSVSGFMIHVSIPPPTGGSACSKHGHPTEDRCEDDVKTTQQYTAVMMVIAITARVDATRSPDDSTS